MFLKNIQPLAHPKMSSKQLLPYPLLFIFVTVLAVRCQTFFHNFYNGDEANYAAHAMQFLAGGWPYVDFVEKKPPLIYAFYALSFKLFGPNLYIIHVITAFWIFLSALFVYKIFDRFTDRTHAFVGGMLYALFTSCFIELDVFATNCEILMNLPLILAAYLFFLGITKKDTPSNMLYLLLSGIMTSFGFLFKHQAGIILPTVFMFLFYKFIKRDIQIKKLIKISTIFFLGFVIPISIISLIYYEHGYFKNLYEWNILYNLSYISGSSPLTKVLTDGFITSAGFILANLILFISFLSLLGKLKMYLETNKMIVIFSLIWFYLSIIPVTMGGRFYGHYYIQLYPPLILLSTFGIVSFLKNLSLTKKTYKYLGLTLLILPTFVFQILALYRTQHGTYEGAWPVHQKIANAIIKSSNENDKIFVWGNYAYPYSLANRLPATRYIVCEYVIPYWEKYLNGNNHFNFSKMHPYKLKEFNHLMKDLKSGKPSLILDTSNSPYFKNFSAFKFENLPPLQDYIQKNYKLLTDVDGVKVYKKI